MGLDKLVECLEIAKKSEGLLGLTPSPEVFGSKDIGGTKFCPIDDAELC